MCIVEYRHSTRKALYSGGKRRTESFNTTPLIMEKQYCDVSQNSNVKSVKLYNYKYKYLDLNRLSLKCCIYLRETHNQQIRVCSITTSSIKYLLFKYLLKDITINYYHIKKCIRLQALFICTLTSI